MRTDSGSFQPLSGRLLAAPAIASVPDPSGTNAGYPLYIVTGADHQLWVRGQNFTWRLLSSKHTYCIDNPAAVVVKGFPDLRMAVGCEGSDHALWWALSPALTYGTPPPLIDNWMTLGGTLSAGPAVSDTDSTGRGINSLTFFVLGTDQHIYIIQPLSSQAAFGRTDWRCIGHPAAADELANGSEFALFACHGIDGQLWVSNNTNAAGWVNTRPVGGKLIDGPGIANSPTAPSASFVYVEGLDQSVWQFSFQNTVWTRIGGAVQHGVGAAGLLYFASNP